MTDWVPWVSPDRARRIEDSLETVGPGPLKAVFEHLGGPISYDEIRIVAAYIANRDAS